MEYIRKHLWLYSIVLISFLAQCQENENLTSSEYHLFYNLELYHVTNNGTWINYTHHYDEGLDTTFVKNTQTGIQYAIQDSRKLDFSEDSKWVAWQLKNKVELMNLEGEPTKKELEGYNFLFSPSGRYLATQSYEKDKSSGLFNLKVLDLKNGRSFVYQNIREFRFKKTSDVLAIISVNEGDDHLKILPLNYQNKSKEIISTSQKLHGLNWHKSGQCLVFLEEERKDSVNTTNKIYYYSSLRKPEIKVFDPAEKEEFKEIKISQLHFVESLISDDRQKVFFYIQPDLEQKSTILPDTANTTEVWNTYDKYSYPGRDRLEWPKTSSKLCVWNVEDDSFFQLGSKEQDQVVLTGDRQYALSFNTNDYKPRHRYKDDYMDFYLTDIATGKKHLILKKQLWSRQITMVSPGGKYINFFRNGNWWVYNIAKGSISNLTKDLHLTFEDPEYNGSGGYSRPYGSAGWIPGDKAILINDEYDIWMISDDGLYKKRITHGREKGIRFRIYKRLDGRRRRETFFGFEDQKTDLTGNIILEAFGMEDKKSGYYLWNSKKGMQKMVYKDKNIRGLLSGKKSPFYFYIQEDYGQVPQIMKFSIKDNSNPPLTTASKEISKFSIGKSKLIQYTSEKGHKLQGALFYPANYDPTKKYPMITYIYETLSDELHKYVPPSKKMTTGFNVANFTSEGYFVLYPDIWYEASNPGKSALHCVIPAVKAAMKIGSIDSAKIGLAGHSHGGYETSFIITQTNLFAAAVAGAPITDLVSFYFTYLWNRKKSNFWTFEAQQLRMEASYFEKTGNYVDNSPLQNADKINTPLLTWVGKKDDQIPWSQSIEFYLALRRLGKKNVLIVYPEEGHVLMDPKDQWDNYLRTKAWFDYYLKGAIPEKWIVNHS